MATQAIKQVAQTATKSPRMVLEMKLSCYDNRVVKMAERLKMAADMLNVKVPCEHVKCWSLTPI